MAELRISADLALPLDYLTMATVVYGARGSGKTNLGVVLAEELHQAGQRFCAIDLKGDWWGLKSTSDGKGPGIPVVIFGGEHADIPIEDNSGSEVGKLAAEIAVSVVVDLEYLSKGKQVRWLKGFFASLYHENRTPLLVIADEVQRYAPQRPMSPDETMCLAAVEDLVKLGRKHGLGIVCLTQRGAGLNKEVSELCDVLVAMRTPGPIDQERIKDWLDANTTREQRDQVMRMLAKLPTGTAVFASGHPDIDLFQVVQVRRRRTYDSSATPRVGEIRKTPLRMADVDLSALQERMAATLERARQDDPRELRRRIGELERQLHEVPARVEKVIERVEVPVLGEHERRLLKDLNEKLDSVGTWLQAVKRDVAPVLAQVTVTPTLPAPVVEPEPPRLPSSMRRTTGNSGPVENGELTAPQQRILDALACFERVGISSVARANVAVWADQSPRSSGFTNNLGRLRTLGMLEYPSGGLVTLTDRGRELATCLASITSRAELHTAWFAKLSNPQARILQALIHEYPQPMSRAELADAAGQSASSSGYTNNLGALRSLGLLDYPRSGVVVATELLFPEGLS